MINEMRGKINGMTFEKIEIQYPIFHTENGNFKIDESGRTVRFAERGAGYYYNRIRNTKKIEQGVKDFFSWASFTEKVRDEEWVELQKHINSAHLTLVKAGIDKPNYAVAINGEVRGVLTKNYDFLDHNLILDKIEENNLKINTWFIDQEKLVARLHVNSKDKNTGMGVSVRLINGHAGYNALSFSVVITDGEYLFSVPEHIFKALDKDKNTHVITQRNRHLSYIDDTFSNLKLLMDSAGEYKINEQLRSENAKALFRFIEREVGSFTKKQEEIMNSLERQIFTFNVVTDGYEVVQHIVKYIEVSRYKTAATNLLDELFKHYVH
jgi:hypothetical protein